MTRLLVFGTIVVLALPVVGQQAAETGLASWYGYPYHGRTSAGGEVYNMETLTAAHRTLPFNTVVHVVNLQNQKTVDVRITDRGPFVDGRIIDLSHAAARAIGVLEPGTAPVRLEVLDGVPIPQPPPQPLPTPVQPPEPAVLPKFAVQVGSFRSRANAERMCASMRTRYGNARIVARDGEPVLWRVMVWDGAGETAARALSARIQQDSTENNPFLVRLTF